MNITNVGERPSAGTSKTAPGPRGLDSLLLMRNFRHDPIASLTSLYRKYGDVVGFKLGPVDTVLLTHPDHVDIVYQSRRRNYSRDIGLSSVSKGLLGEKSVAMAVEEESWKRYRRILQPVFRLQTLLGYSGSMTDEIGAMLERWAHAAARAEAVDAAQEMAKISLQITLRVLFGVQGTDALDRLIRKEFLFLSTDLTQRLMSVIPLPPILPVPQDIRWWISRRRLDSVLNGVIADRRRKAIAAGGDLLGTLMTVRDETTGQGLSDEEIRDNAKTFLFGGYETTSSALAWSLYLLALHPKVRGQLEREADEVLGGRVPTADDVPRLPLARAVFEEANRLFPPIWVSMRRALEADEIGGYKIARGASIMTSPYVLQHDATYWDDPETFSPERFLGDVLPKRSRSAYIPFGAGPQACIGRGFALLEGQLTLAMIAQRYRVTLALPHPVAPEPTVTLRPGGPIPVRLEPRG